jgi:hypothetical protein
MKRKHLIPLLLLFMILFAIPLWAQPDVRPEDHFFRRRVVNRLDLTEKINWPLVQRESVYYGDNARFPHQEGIVSALLEGLRQGDFVAYHPDDFNIPLQYDDVLSRMQEFDNIYGEEESFMEEDLHSDGDGLMSEFELEEFEPGTGASGLASSGGNAFGPLDDLSPYESVMHIVEDRIFDKNTSTMIYRMDYIQIIWTDPGETLPEKVLACFRIADAAEVLEKTQWKNRFNDAEYRSVKEALDLRIFNSYVLNVSGYGSKSLEEAEMRRNQLVEYEHHLWSF